MHENLSTSGQGWKLAAEVKDSQGLDRLVVLFDRSSISRGGDRRVLLLASRKQIYGNFPEPQIDAILGPQ